MHMSIMINSKDIFRVKTKKNGSVPLSIICKLGEKNVAN